MRFIDEINIRIASGSGGPGAVSFRREAMTPRGGPDGGDGGKGGDLVVRVNRQMSSLVHLRPNKRYAGVNGQPGSGANSSGESGADFILEVPAGTIIRDESGEVLVDMAHHSEVVLLKGGRGGKGNAFFKTSVNQAPEHAQPGESGVEKHVSLELKLIADVGIIGLPNAGKSTLISRISAAKPKIADYPFTTLVPNLGVVLGDEARSIVVADIPGLIRGAHTGTGLGIQFLKHVERTRIFVHLVDVSQGSPEECWQAFADIQHELQAYDEMNAQKEGFFALSQRDQVIALSKIETITKEQLEKIQKFFKTQLDGSHPLFTISAVTGRGLEDLKRALFAKVFEEKGEAT